MQLVAGILRRSVITLWTRALEQAVVSYEWYATRFQRRRGHHIEPCISAKVAPRLTPDQASSSRGREATSRPDL